MNSQISARYAFDDEILPVMGNFFAFVEKVIETHDKNDLEFKQELLQCIKRRMDEKFEKYTQVKPIQTFP